MQPAIVCTSVYDNHQGKIEITNISFFINISAVASIDARGINISRHISRQKRTNTLQDLIPVFNLGSCSLIANDSRNASYQLLDRFRIFVFCRTVFICSSLVLHSSSHKETNQMTPASKILEMFVNCAVMICPCMLVCPIRQGGFSFTDV